MPVILSHNSALECLRAMPTLMEGRGRFEGSFSMASVSSGIAELAHLAEAEIIRQRPVHLIVPSCSYRRMDSRVRAHRMNLSMFPQELLVRISEETYSAGPELAFVQMAPKMSLLGAIVLGYELCGTYSHFASMVSGYYDRPPLTSTARIGEAICQLKGLYGLSHAERALAWIRDGSASPMETVEACRLSFPRSAGGEGFVLPELNYEVLLDPSAQKLAGARLCRIDLAWPEQRIGVEYDGSAYHVDAAADRRRREALAHMGWKVFAVDLTHLKNKSEHNKLVSVLIGEIPQFERAFKESAAVEAELLDRLLAATRLGVGMEAALFAKGVPKGRYRLHVA